MPKHIGQEIKRLREERKLSKARLAREAGFSDAYLVQIEKGDRTPSPNVLEAIAKALRIPPHVLLVAAGVYTEEEVAEATQDAERHAKQIEEQRGRPVTQEERDRLLYFAYEEIDRVQAMREYYQDQEALEEDYRQQQIMQDPLGVPSELFWQWDTKSSWAPEHWDDLTDRDRRMVQQFINRLVELGAQN